MADKIQNVEGIANNSYICLVPNVIHVTFPEDKVPDVRSAVKALADNSYGEAVRGCEINVRQDMSIGVGLFDDNGVDVEDIQDGIVLNVSSYIVIGEKDTS